MNKKMQKWVLGRFALAAAVFIVVAGCVNASDALPETGTGTQSETETIAEPKGLLRLSFGTVEVENIASREVTVYIPYSAGFNPAALDVTAELEEGAAMMPVIKGPQDFSKPKKIKVRTADGVISDYTITVYALFSGEESLPDLATYTNWNEDTGGTALMPDEEKPLYIALEGIALDGGYTVPVIEPISNWGTDYPPGTSPLIRLFGAEETWYHDRIPGYTHGQYIALDLSRTDTVTLQGSPLPLGNHSSATGTSYFAEGPFSRVKAITFPPNLRTLGESLFQGNEVLTSITLPEGVQTVAYAAFAGAKKLTSATLPSTLKTIEKYAFMETALEDVTLPQGLSKIGLGAFSGTKIKRVILPASVIEAKDAFNSIGTLEYADSSSSSIDELSTISGGFSGCGSLKEVYLPETLSRIGAFSLSFGGAKLEKMVVYASIPPILPAEYSTSPGHLDEPRPYFTSSAFKIYVPDENVNRYKTASGVTAGWSQYADRIHPLSELEGAVP